MGKRSILLTFNVIFLLIVLISECSSRDFYQDVKQNSRPNRPVNNNYDLSYPSSGQSNFGPNQNYRPNQNNNNNNQFGFPNNNQFNRPVQDLDFGSSAQNNQFINPNQNSQSNNNRGLNVVFNWRQLDFQYPSDSDRSNAIQNGEFIQQNCLPLAVDVWGDKVFMTVPRWRNGTPASLVWFPRNSNNQSPLLNPYPNWGSHSGTGSKTDCTKIFSVFRMAVDECDRLWVLDSGEENVASTRTQTCPPKLLIFDLNTDRLLTQYVFPENFRRDQGLYASIVIDIRNGQCTNAFAYMTDIWRFSIAVFDLRQNSATLLSHGYFLPDPVFTRFTNGNFVYRLISGIFSIALGPVVSRSDQSVSGLIGPPSQNDRILYFHAMSNSREYQVLASAVRNQTYFNANPDCVQVVGQSRGPNGHASASSIDQNGVMFFNMVTRNSLGCWDIRKPYRRGNLDTALYQDDVTMYFGNDLKLSQTKNNQRQSIWILSNRLPDYLFRQLNPGQFNFHILTGFTDQLVQNSVCNPQQPARDTSRFDPTECY